MTRFGSIVLVALTLSGTLLGALPTPASAQSWRDRDAAADRERDRGWRGQGNNGG